MSEQELQRLIAEAADQAVLKYSQDHPKTCPLKAEDVVFIHSFRRKLDKFATGIGMAIILAVISAIAFIFKLGLEHWKG